MKRMPLNRGKSELARTPMKRTGRPRSKRETPRRREAPKWSAEEWEDANLLLMARAGDRCECCGAPLNGTAERHHRVRRRDGGDRLSNLLLLLPKCHAHWTREPTKAKARGIIVEPWRDSADVPVLWRGQVHALLDDDGTMERVLIPPEHPDFLP